MFYYYIKPIGSGGGSTPPPSIPSMNLLVNWHYTQEPSASNFINYSEDLSNGVWQKTITNVSAGSMYDGTIQLYKVTPTTTYSSEHSVKQSVFFAEFANYPNTVTFSFIAKAAAYTSVGIYFSNNTSWDLAVNGEGVAWDLANGTVVRAPSKGTAAIADLGGGYYRCTCSVGVKTNAWRTISHQLINVAPNGTFWNVNGELIPYSGNGTDGVEIGGVQINLGSSLLPYVKTTTRVPINLANPAQFNPVFGVNTYLPAMTSSGISNDSNDTIVVGDDLYNYVMGVDRPFSVNIMVKIVPVNFSTYVTFWSSTTFNSTNEHFGLAYTESSNVPYFWIKRPGLSQHTLGASTVLADNVFYMLTLVYYGTSATLFVNGVKDPSITNAACTLNGISALNRFNINHAYYFSPANIFKGITSTFQFYERAITDIEVTALYNFFKNNYNQYYALP